MYVFGTAHLALQHFKITQLPCTTLSAMHMQLHLVEVPRNKLTVIHATAHAGNNYCNAITSIAREGIVLQQAMGICHGSVIRKGGLWQSMSKALLSSTEHQSRCYKL